MLTNSLLKASVPNLCVTQSLAFFLSFLLKRLYNAFLPESVEVIHGKDYELGVFVLCLGQEADLVLIGTDYVFLGTSYRKVKEGGYLSCGR